MYKSHHLVFGFHGCDASTSEKVIAGEFTLKKSENEYDWLGSGIYFWENDPERALEYAEFLKNNPHRSRKAKINRPAAIGAIIDLGYCLNLLESNNLTLLQESYNIINYLSNKEGFVLPTNSGKTDKTEDLVIRRLDCQVIEMIHVQNKNMHRPEYDTVRGVFWEGAHLYLNSGFKGKNHIQIAVRNPNCIKGFFYPRKFDTIYSRPA